MKPTMPSELGGLILCAVALLAIPAVSRAQSQACPDGDTHAARVDVTVDAKNAGVTVAPSTVEVYLKPGPTQPARVCWVIAGLADGNTLRLTDKSASGETIFPQLQRDVKGGKNPFLTSGNPARSGTWQYGVEVTDSAGKTVARVDPEVIVKGGGSS